MRTDTKERLPYAVASSAAGLGLWVLIWTHTSPVALLIRNAVGDSTGKATGEAGKVTNAIGGLASPLKWVIIAAAPLVLLAGAAAWTFSGRVAGVRLIQGVMVGLVLMVIAGPVVA